jgi:hypothetical protein
VESKTDLYTQDFYAWCLTTATLIRQGKWYDIDREALAEEIESLAVPPFSLGQRPPGWWSHRHCLAE